MCFGSHLFAGNEFVRSHICSSGISKYFAYILFFLPVSMGDWCSSTYDIYCSRSLGPAKKKMCWHCSNAQFLTCKGLLGPSLVFSPSLYIYAMHLLSIYKNRQRVIVSNFVSLTSNKNIWPWHFFRFCHGFIIFGTQLQKTEVIAFFKCSLPIKLTANFLLLGPCFVS